MISAMSAFVQEPGITPLTDTPIFDTNGNLVEEGGT